MIIITARAQAAEGYSLLSGMKTPMVEAISSSSLANACPTTAATAAIGTTAGTTAGAAAGAAAGGPAWFKQAVKSGKYVKDVSLTAGTNASTCLMTATFKAATEGVNDKVAGKKIGMKFNSSNGTWKCGTDLEPNIAPAACNEALPT